EAALTGRRREHHCFLLTAHREQLAFLNRQIAQFSERITAQIDRLSGPVEPRPAAESGGREADRAAATDEEPAAPPTPASRSPWTRVPPATYRAAIQLMDPIP